MQRPEEAFFSYKQTRKDPYFIGALGKALKRYCLDYSQSEATLSKCQQSFNASPGKGTFMANSTATSGAKIFRRQPNRSRVQQCTGLNFD